MSPPENAPLYPLCPPISCATHWTVPVFTGMPDLSTTRELLSMAHTPCGIPSTGDTTIDPSAGTAMGRWSADLRRRAKNWLKVLHCDGSSYQPRLSPKISSACASRRYSLFHDSGVLRNAPHDRTKVFNHELYGSTYSRELLKYPRPSSSFSG